MSDDAGEEAPLLPSGPGRLQRYGGPLLRLRSFGNFSSLGGGGGESPEPDGPGEEVAGGGDWHRCHTQVGLPPAFVAHFALGAGTFTQGYDQTALGFLLATGYGGHLRMSAWEQGVVTSIFFAGGIMGAYVSAQLNDSWGRRRPLLAAALLVVLTGLLGTTTTYYPWLLAVRFGYGVAAGMNNASLAIYLAEITRKRERGGVVAMTELLFAVGGCVACAVQLGLQRLWPDADGQANSWRFLVGVESLFGLVMLAGSAAAVESPHWLLQKGRDWEAERVLLRIHAPDVLPFGGCNCLERNSELSEAVEGLRQQLDDEAKRPEGVDGEWPVLSTLGLLASPERRVRRALELAVAMSLVPLIGIGCLPQQFVPLVLGGGGAQAGTRPGAIPVPTILMDFLCNLIYTVGAGLQCFLLVDRIGRRWPLILSLLGAGCGFLLVSRSLSSGGSPATALLGVTLGYACRALGVGPLPQVVGAEVIPLHILTRAKAASTMLRRCCAMLYCLLLPPILSLLGGPAVFTSQAWASAAAALFVWLRLPETRGFEISEIDSILSTVDWVPFSSAPPQPSMADVVREQAVRQGARRDAKRAAAKAEGGAGESELPAGPEEYDVWGGRGVYRSL